MVVVVVGQAYIDALVLNRQALARRAADLEKDIQRDLQTADGNGSDRNKTMRSKAQIEVIKERVVMRRKDLELIKQFMDMDGSKLAGTLPAVANGFAGRRKRHGLTRACIGGRSGGRLRQPRARCGRLRQALQRGP